MNNEQTTNIKSRYENLRNVSTQELKDVISNNYELFNEFKKTPNIKPHNVNINNLSEETWSFLNDIYSEDTEIVDIRTLTGRGYDEFLKSTNKFLVVKGSRGSKKSRNTALKFVWIMIMYPLSNLVCFRFMQETNKDSTYLAIIWALGQFKLLKDIDYTVNETTKEITFIKTNQSIRFRGIRNAGVKNTSLEVKQIGGFWNLAWLDEAYEVSNKYVSDFDKIIDSFARAKMPEGYFSQFIITFNPYSEKIWLKDRFFNEDVSKRQPDTLAMTTTWRSNEFLDQSFIDMRLHEEEHNPRKARVNSLGQWGMVDGLIFDDSIEVRDFEPMKLPIFRGIDFGKSNDPNAYVASYLDIENKTIYVFNEYYKTYLDTDEMKTEIIDKFNLVGKTVFAEVEPAYNKSLAKNGVNIIQVYKKPNNILNELDILSTFKIVIHPSCKNFIFEIESYAIDENGKPVDKDNHLMDAFRYSYNAVLYPDQKRYKYLKNGDREKASVSSVYSKLNKLI